VPLMLVIYQSIHRGRSTARQSVSCYYGA